MSDAIGVPSVESEPKRHSRLADFLTRLVKEKPLGIACGIIILILIFVGIFGGVLAPYPHKEIHMVDRLQGASAKYLLGTDQCGARFIQPPYLRSSYFVTYRSGSDRAQCGHRCPDRRHFRIPWG